VIGDRDDAHPYARTLPPYVAFKTLEEFLQRARREEVPATVHAGLLKRWGIAAGNESALITSLKALGLIDSSGCPTETFHEVRLSAPRRLKALQRAAEHAYPDLGVEVGAPIEDDRLHDYFVARRGLRGQMVQKAMRFYRRLEQVLRGERSGPEPAAPFVRHQAPVSSTPAAPDATALVSTEENLRLSLVVQLPSNVSEQQLAEFVAGVYRAWRRARSQA
jgi:hypothetical protein